MIVSQADEHATSFFNNYKMDDILDKVRDAAEGPIV